MKQQSLRYQRHAERGMSLMELMIVVAIVALLGTIAVSSYRRQMLRANRVDGTAVLLQIQVAQEKFFLQNRRYAANAELSNPPPGGLGIPVASPGGNYTLSLVAPTATTYTATATATGAQTDDTTCPVYTITETGQRTPANSTGCWR